MRPTTRRRGMTLVEIMISLVLLGIVSGVIMRVITRQQRFYTGVNQIMTQRGQLRQATSVLPMDLRSLSSIGDDLIAVSDSAIEFDVNIGAGIICELVAGGAQIVLPPPVLASGHTFTTWYGYGEPDTDDITRGVSVYVYNDSNTVGNEDDRWHRYNLTAVHHNASSCLASFTTVADVGKLRPILELADPGGLTDAVTGGPISRYIGVGAPVRLVKRVRYNLYVHSDGKSYLGFSEWDKASAGYGPVSPVSGPYDPYATGSGTATGFGFRYYDVEGVEIAAGADEDDRKRIARVDLIARARTSQIHAAGIQNGVSQQYKDSLAVSVMLRNRQ